MAASASILLRAPGVYPYPDTPIAALTGVRMDVCAFCGVAPRGPVRVPVVNEKWLDTVPQTEPDRPINRTRAFAVESFTEYQQLYGGFEGPGLLPYAVASFFEQGGKRAYIARVVHDYGAGDPRDKDRVASGTLTGASTSTNVPILLRARNEGSWGNLLRANLSFSAKPILFERATASELVFDENADISQGDLLRLTFSDGTQLFCAVAALVTQARPDGPGAQLVGVLETPVAGISQAAEIVSGVLSVDDGAGLTEMLTGLGLCSGHPRWAATVLCNESSLVFPDASWSDLDIVPTNLNLKAVLSTEQQQFQGGGNAYSDITPADFFDTDWSITDEVPGQGVQCLSQLPDLALLAVPDLYSPAPIPPPSDDIIDPVSLAGSDFAVCVDLPVQPSQVVAGLELLGLRLDPQDPSDLQTIIGLQQQVVAFAEACSQFVVLLDVPPTLTQPRILNWRANFNSSYAACYHPWLFVSRRDATDSMLVQIPPSAPAAGIIANSAIRFGLPTGPANVLAAQAIDVTDVVSPTRHDQLHPMGINVYLRDRDGVRLTAARTLSRNPQYRQLTVRRLITLIRLSLYQQMQWAVFEPNTPALRLEIRLLLENFLRSLFRQGAFSGATEADSFFVRCDSTNNPPYISDTGKLIAEIGVAPSEPIEFILVRISREGDGTLSVQD